MKILIVDDNDCTRHLVISCLEQGLEQLEIVEVTSAKMAKALYSSDPYFELVLMSLDLASDSPLGFYQFLHSDGFSVKMLTYSNSDPQETLPKIVNLNLTEQEIPLFSDKLFSALSLSPKVEKEDTELPSKDLTENQSYKKVRLCYFWRFHQLAFPLFLKLSEEKYVKILNSNQIYGLEFIEKYEGKHQNYLYIRNKDFDQFLELLYQKPLYEEDPNLSSEEKLLRSQHFIQSMALSSGLSPDLIEVANKSIQELEKFCNTKKSLTKMINILRKRSGYSSDHATLLCYITSALCDALGWSARRSKEKLALASLFHDITLSNQRMASINYLDDLDSLGLNKDDLSRYYDHPKRAAELVSEALSQYPQVDTIIANHHERPDGSGFPFARSYNQIPPLASLFIVAHDFVSRLYKANLDLSNAEDILNGMRAEYTMGHFSKCLKALFETIEH